MKNPLGFPRIVVLPAAAGTALVAGLVLHAFSDPVAGGIVWTLGLWLTSIPVLIRTTRGLLQGRFAADLVAALAIVTALVLGQPFAGLVIVLMQTGGEALEYHAGRRASAAVRELEARAPRLAHRQLGDEVSDVPAEEVAVGQTIQVLPGELVPCDGVVVSGTSHVDLSHLTGEPLPLLAETGTVLRSGSHNLDGPILLRTTASAGASMYARIVELVRTAQASKAPLQRVADRYAIWFTPLVIAVAVVVYALTSDPLRVLAVLVVATPCPLILATPVAIVGGINRAARRQIIMRHGGALEALAAVDAVVFDKTGTLTIGRPEVAEVTGVPPFDADTVLALAGAVEQGSSHLLARTVVAAARRAGISLEDAVGIREVPGRGVSGTVGHRSVLVGALSLVRDREPGAARVREEMHDGRSGLRAYVAVDGQAAGTISYADRLRPGALDLITNLRRMGFRRIALLSGDRFANVTAVAREIGIEEVAADLLPQDKVSYVTKLSRESRRVLMVGDGTNDAPALSTAAVGLALAEHGGGIAAEAADVVLLVDDLARVPEAVAIGRRTLRIARQSILAGLGLSAVGIVFAAAGVLPPAAGALVQEGIDVAVILNALRSIR